MALVVGVLLAAPSTVVARTFYMSDGRQVEGEIKSVSLESAYVIVTLPDRTETTLYFKDLTPRSQYEVRAQVASSSDPIVHVTLGQYCVDHGLVAEAEFEFRTARDLARTIASDANALLLATMETRAVALAQEADELGNRGYHEQALKIYLRLHQFYHHTSVGPAAAAKIKALLDKLGLPEELPAPVDPDARQAPDNGGGVNPAQPNPNEQDMLEGLSGSERRKYEQASAKLQAAIDSLDKSDDLIQQLIAQYTGRGINSNDSKLADLILLGPQGLEKARQGFEEVINDPPDRKVYAGMIARARAALTRYETLLFRLALHMAHGYAQYNQTEQGSIWVNRILAVTPDHEEARYLRRLITEKALLEKR